LKQNISAIVVPYPIKSASAKASQKDNHANYQHNDKSNSALPKFGEVPTNRVLPVDHLTEADYEDIINSNNEEIRLWDGVGSRDYCSRLFKLEYMKVIFITFLLSK
jgi:hypothetical protein